MIAPVWEKKTKILSHLLNLGLSGLHLTLMLLTDAEMQPKQPETYLGPFRRMCYLKVPNATRKYER